MSTIHSIFNPPNRLFQPVIYILVVLTLLLTGFHYLSASPCLAKPSHKQLTARINQVNLELNRAANSRLSQAMETTASWLSAFSRRWGHFPSSYEQITFAKAQLLKRMPVNPYHQTINESNKIDTSEDSILINLKVYPQLSEELIQTIHESPPSDWQAAPGTITVLTNGDALLAIWGAGSNHRPIINPQTCKPFMIFARYSP